MENEERHDLRENDLQNFLENLGDFWGRWGNTILIGLTIVLVIVAGLNLYRTQKQQAHENAWRDLATTTSPATFVQVADKHSINSVKTIAQLRAGDMYLAKARETQEVRKKQEAQGTQGTEQGQEETSVAQGADEGGEPTRSRRELLDYAQKSYQTVLDEGDVAAIYRINARLGLASVAESHEQWDVARGQFEKVVSLAGSKYPNAAAHARARLDMLVRLKSPTPFGTEPATSQKAQPDSPKPIRLSDEWPYLPEF